MTFDGMFSNERGEKAGLNASDREDPAKYGRQFSDQEIAQSAVRLFGKVAEKLSRERQVELLNAFDEKVKGSLS